MIEEQISEIIQRLREQGLNIKEYKEPYEYPDFTHGFMIQLNNIPFLLLYNVVEDLLESQEKLDNFVDTIKKISKHE